MSDTFAFGQAGYVQGNHPNSHGGLLGAAPPGIGRENSSQRNTGRLRFRYFEESAIPLFQEPGLRAHFNGCNHQDMADLIGPMPTDPENRLRWEAVKGAEEVLKKRFQHSHQFEQRLARQAARSRKLEILQKSDPLFERTIHLMGDYLAGLYPTTLRLLERELDRSPNAFMELYGDIREEAERIEHVLHRRKRNVGRSAPARAADPRAHELEALIRKVRAGQAEEGDLLTYLELTGAGS